MNFAIVYRVLCLHLAPEEVITFRIFHKTEWDFKAEMETKPMDLRYNR